MSVHAPLAPVADGGPPPGWYHDASSSSTAALRYWDGRQWTGFTGNAGSPSRRRGSRWWVWAIAGVFAMLSIGLYLAVESLESYSTDLTVGHGDLREFDLDEGSATYEDDGYHLTVTEAGTYVPSGVRAPTAHQYLGVEITAAVVRGPAASELGPICLEGGDRGYGFLLAADGSAALVSIDGRDIETLAAGEASRPWRGTSELTLACELLGGDHLRGFVDGEQVLQASGPLDLDEVEFTGFMGGLDDDPPAEWRVERFARLDPDDLPD